MDIKTKKAEETRENIVASAQKLFHKKGFEETSVREIVEDAGYAKGTFYLYFETKMDILCYIAEKLFMNFSELICYELSTVSDDPFSQIEGVFNKMLLHIREKDGNLKWFHTHEILKLVLEQKISDEFINSTITQITKFLKMGIEKGYFRELNPELYGKIIFSIGHDMLESAMLFKFPADIQSVKDELMLIFRKILEK